VACARCDGTHWVCENHPDRPLGRAKGLRLYGAGDPCPACNDAAPELMPLPPGFENSITSIEVMRPLLRNPAGKRRRKP
jgi:hypothetical protein